MDTSAVNDKNRKIQSVEIGFGVLRAISEKPSGVNLTELANMTGLFKSQLYRYLNTFVDLGVLARHEGEVPRWSLGPELISLGSKAFESLDVAKQAAANLAELRDVLNETVALSIWRERGPFFVRWEKSNKPFNVGLGIGSYVPLYTATGKIFRAWLPLEVTDPLYQAEVEAGHIQPEAYAAEVQKVREDGISVTQSSLVSGITAVSTPLFDASGSLAGALSVVGVHGYLDTSPEGLPAQALRTAAISISRKLGYNRTD